MSSVTSRKYFTSLLSRTGTPHVKLCVAWALPARPREPMPSLTWPSALACSFMKRQVFPLDRHVFIEFCGLALNIECSLQRLLQGHTEFIMDCSAIANITESVAKLGACGFLCNPAIGKFHGCCAELVTRAVQVILQTTLSRYARVLRPLPGLRHAVRHRPRHGDLKVHTLSPARPVPPRTSDEGRRPCRWLRRSSCTWRSCSLATVEQSVKFTQSPLRGLFIRSCII